MVGLVSVAEPGVGAVSVQGVVEMATVSMLVMFGDGKPVALIMARLGLRPSVPWQ